MALWARTLQELLLLRERGGGGMPHTARTPRVSRPRSAGGQPTGSVSHRAQSQHIRDLTDARELPTNVVAFRLPDTITGTTSTFVAVSTEDCTRGRGSSRPCSSTGADTQSAGGASASAASVGSSTSVFQQSSGVSTSSDVRPSLPPSRSNGGPSSTAQAYADGGGETRERAVGSERAGCDPQATATTVTTAMTSGTAPLAWGLSRSISLPPIPRSRSPVVALLARPELPATAAPPLPPGAAQRPTTYTRIRKAVHQRRTSMVDLRGDGRAVGMGATEASDGMHAPPRRIQRRVTMYDVPARPPAPSPRLTGVADKLRWRQLPPKLLTKCGAEKGEGSTPPTETAAPPADDSAGEPANSGGSGDGVRYDDQVAPTPRRPRASAVLSACVSAVMGAAPPSQQPHRSQQAPRRHPRIPGARMPGQLASEHFS
jgi:hypothetical protein